MSNLTMVSEIWRGVAAMGDIGLAMPRTNLSGRTVRVWRDGSIPLVEVVLTASGRLKNQVGVG